MAISFVVLRGVSDAFLGFGRGSYLVRELVNGSDDDRHTGVFLVIIVLEMNAGAGR